jgi:glycerate dehydrogenase
MTETLPLNITWADVDTVFGSSDIMSLHCPLTDETAFLVNKINLKKMKPSAFLINTSRGGLINENDLFYALDHEVIAGAGLDVMVQEPPHITNPLMYHSKAVITPHIAWASQPARAVLLDRICDCIIAYRGGKPIINSVT